MTTANFFYGKQSIDSTDVYEVIKSLKKNLITGGDYVRKFEDLCRKKIQAKYALACNSGTSAILLAYLAIGVKKGDIIIMPAVNFVAAANMAKLLGAKIYLADIDSTTGQITQETVLTCIKNNNIKKIKALLVMYMGGYPRSIIEFYKLKKKLNCYLIEDACHAFGSSYYLNNKKFMIGSCAHSDISTFSFHPLKSITTGEGGLISTNIKSISDKIKLFRSHGIKKSKFYWDYSVESLGYNFRLSDINCALGFSQLKKLKSFLAKRKLIYNIYKEEFKNNKYIQIISAENNTSSSYHLVIGLIDFKKLGVTKNFFLKKLQKKKIYCQYHYIPIFFFKNFILKNSKSLQNSYEYYNQAVSFPVYYDLKIKDLYKIITEIKKILL
jgi:dTDP-4-amino-4,6-dideoxygalactose transaminase